MNESSLNILHANKISIADGELRSPEIAARLDSIKGVAIVETTRVWLILGLILCAYLLWSTGVVPPICAFALQWVIMFPPVNIVLKTTGGDFVVRRFSSFNIRRCTGPLGVHEELKNALADVVQDFSMNQDKQI